MQKPGDKIKVITRDKEFLGILMPNESENSIFIKLDNGYNIGIDRKEIKKIENHALVPSTREELEKVLAENHGKLSTKISAEVFITLEKLLGKFEIEI